MTGFAGASIFTLVTGIAIGVAAGNTEADPDCKDNNIEPASDSEDVGSFRDSITSPDQLVARQDSPPTGLLNTRVSPLVVS